MSAWMDAYIRASLMGCGYMYSGEGQQQLDAGVSVPLFQWATGCSEGTKRTAS